MKKQIFALLSMSLLLAACSSEPTGSTSPSITPSMSPAAIGCTLPAEVSAIIGSAAATATVADFVPLNTETKAPDATLLPAGYVSPFAGQKFFFTPEASADEARAGRDVTTDSNALGNFVAGSAGGLVNSAIFLPTAAGSLSNLDTGTLYGELGVRPDTANFQSIIDLLDNDPGFFTAPSEGGYARIGGIAVGADTLYMEFLSTWINTLRPEEALPADFPLLAIAHHPSAMSAEAAVAGATALGAAAQTVSFCVNNELIDFTVLGGTQIGIAEADLGARAQNAEGVELSLAVAAVEVDDQHYTIARAMRLRDGVLTLASPIGNDEFQLAVWPGGSLSK